MSEHAAAHVSIGLELRFVLFGLQAVLDCTFSPQEIERVFADALADQVSPKEYHFYTSGSVALTGVVDAYEPESIHLRLRARDASALLSRITDSAHYEIVRLQRANEPGPNARFLP